MRLASLTLTLSLLMVFSAAMPAVGQSPRGDRPDDRPPMPREMQEGFDRHDGDRRDHGWRGRMMNEAEAREALEVLRKIDPEKAERLEQAINENPERVGILLRENFPNLGRFMAWRRYDPEGFDLRIQDFALSRQTRACANRLKEALAVGDAEIAALEELELNDLVAQHFDVRQQIREHELAKLQERIEDLVAQLEERLNNRERFIQERIDELVGNDSSDRW